MKQTGQKLREKREAAHLTISEVSLATKINPKVLAAMETGDLEHLPAKTFLRGFVRSYAGYLRMNVTEILALFNEEIGEVEKREPSPAATTEPATSQPKVDVNGEGSGTFRTIAVGGILVLILLIIAVRSLMQKYERERTVDTAAQISATTNPPADQKKASDAPGSPMATSTDQNASPSPMTAAKNPADADDSGTTKSEISAAPKPGDKSTVKPPEKPVEKAASKPVEKAVEKHDIKPKDKPESQNSPKVNADAKPASVIPETSPPATSPAPESETTEKPLEKSTDKSSTTADRAPSQKKHEIVLEALDNVEVKFSADGQNQKISLGPNQVHTILANGPVTLDVSDGGALNIIDNGQDKGPPGDLGHPKQVSIP